MDGVKIEIDGVNLEMEQIMSRGVNYNIDGAKHVKWSESQHRWSKSHGAKCQVVKYFVVLSSQI